VHLWETNPQLQLQNSGGGTQSVAQNSLSGYS
jgi:hypothetical protein